MSSSAEKEIAVSTVEFCTAQVDTVVKYACLRGCTMYMQARTIVLLALLLVGSTNSWATNYYVDYTNGLDTNGGTAKSAPWKFAPGMAGASGKASTTTINPGDSVILKGCVTWPNSAFTWAFPYAGSSGNLIYVGVDPTWWDSKVPECLATWNRPVLNLGNAPPTDSFYRIIILRKSYVTFDNFEIINAACLPSPGNGSTNIFDWYDNSETNVTVEHMYIHGWNDPVFSVGTGNVAPSGNSVTNFVPYLYAPLVNLAWPTLYSGYVRLQSIPAISIISSGNSSPTVTVISGSNPYTITFTESPPNTGTGCTGCVIQIGGNYCNISGGTAGAQTNDAMVNNVIDGSDTAVVQLNPYPDCGLSEGNNQFCIASATVSWREPNIWRGNFIQYVSSVIVGACQEFSSNIVQYLRLGTDPTGHTNGLECLNDYPVNNTTLFYNNVFQHSTNPNPNVPGGRWSIGLGWIMPSPVAGETAYIFNNVTLDTLQNATFERGSTTGRWIIFNNTSDCGPQWSLTYPCVNGNIVGDLIENNHFISSSSSPIGNCSGYTCTTNLITASDVASAQGYTSNSGFHYEPQSNTSGTVLTGTDLQSLCKTISGVNVAAGTACLNDTTYGVYYNACYHTVTSPSRIANARPLSGAWDIGAYWYGTNGSGQQPPRNLCPAVVAP